MGEVDGETVVTLGGLDETGVAKGVFGEPELSDETELERRRWCPPESIGIGSEWVMLCWPEFMVWGGEQ
jgi:hypothetical protein